MFVTHFKSQLRMAGMGGVIGLDYASVPAIFTAYDIPQDQWWIYLDKLAMLGDIALKYWNSK